MTSAFCDAYSSACPTPTPTTVAAICVGCPHCGCDPADAEGYCTVCGDCDDFADGNPVDA